MVIDRSERRQDESFQREVGEVEKEGRVRKKLGCKQVEGENIQTGMGVRGERSQKEKPVFHTCTYVFHTCNTSTLLSNCLILVSVVLCCLAVIVCCTEINFL